MTLFLLGVNVKFQGCSCWSCQESILKSMIKKWFCKPLYVAGHDRCMPSAAQLHQEVFLHTFSLKQKQIRFFAIKAVLKCSQKGHTYSNYSPHFPAIPLITSAHEIYIVVTVIKCSDIGSTATLAIQVAFSSAPQEPPLCPCFLDQPAMICLVLDTRLDASNLCDVDRSTLIPCAAVLWFRFIL